MDAPSAPRSVDAPSPSPTLVARDAHVTYRVYADRRAGLRQVVAQRFKPRLKREIRALRGVSLSAYGGEAIGIIGRNGAGKSTFLQALAGLLPVTSGAIYASSRPTLLGVSAALKPALSGRRNIIIGGLALGLSRRLINELFDSIVEFAGLSDFIDLPMRTYSSGMRARLHFAIATAVTPEILLIDEALAVGDQEFRVRSKERIDELTSKAGTLFLVSHSANEVRATCSRVFWIDKGSVVMSGETEAVLEAYREGRPAKAVAS